MKDRTKEERKKEQEERRNKGRKKNQKKEGKNGKRKKKGRRTKKTPLDCRATTTHHPISSYHCHNLALALNLSPPSPQLLPFLPLSPLSLSPLLWLAQK